MATREQMVTAGNAPAAAEPLLVTHTAKACVDESDPAGGGWPALVCKTKEHIDLDSEKSFFHAVFTTDRARAARGRW